MKTESVRKTRSMLVVACCVAVGAWAQMQPWMEQPASALWNATDLNWGAGEAWAGDGASFGVSATLGSILTNTTVAGTIRKTGAGTLALTGTSYWEKVAMEGGTLALLGGAGPRDAARHGHGVVVPCGVWSPHRECRCFERRDLR